LWSNAGDYLKQTGTIYWNSPNTGAVNIYGFSSLPSGLRSSSGPYSSININSFFWTSSSSDLDNSWLFSMGNDNSELGRDVYGNKVQAVSARCVKD